MVNLEHFNLNLLLWVGFCTHHNKLPNNVAIYGDNTAGVQSTLSLVQNIMTSITSF